MLTFLFLLLVLALIALAIFDVLFAKDAIYKNFPVVGRARPLFVEIGPKLRQYIVASNNEERPFTRDQRHWIYASSEGKNNYFGFGTDNDLELSPNYLIIKHSAFPLKDKHDELYSVPVAKVMGGYRQRKHAFRPQSIVSVSAMSFGSLSGPAIEAINKGCMTTQALHNTGEGGISKHHKHGAGLIYQLGTGYYGSRAPDGTFDIERFIDTVAGANVKAIEIKLSQGAKPGLGGVLPGKKVTPEIAEARGIPLGISCLSPSAHSAFHDVDSMLDFVELLADKTGLPVGIKSAVGDITFWDDLIEQISTTQRAVDFIAVDGGEGGTGAAPLVFSDHVALPFKLGFSRVYKKFAEKGLHDHIVFMGSGRLGFPEESLFAFALGCDMIYVAREAMMSIGCIQAQKCHDNSCPTGVATQKKWLVRGLNPELKSAQMANYLLTLRKELLRLSNACGIAHPALICPEHLEIITDKFTSKPLLEHFDYKEGWGLPAEQDQKDVVDLIQQLQV